MANKRKDENADEGEIKAKKVKRYWEELPKIQANLENMLYLLIIW